MQPYGVKCQRNGVKFEMEINYLEDLSQVYLVKFKRTAGDTWAFKEVSSKVLQAMNLSA